MPKGGIVRLIIGGGIRGMRYHITTEKLKETKALHLKCGAFSYFINMKFPYFLIIFIKICHLLLTL